jgi:hypothetical protein
MKKYRFSIILFVILSILCLQPYSIMHLLADQSAVAVTKPVGIELHMRTPDNLNTDLSVTIVVYITVTVIVACILLLFLHLQYKQNVSNTD